MATKANINANANAVTQHTTRKSMSAKRKIEKEKIENVKHQLKQQKP